MTNHHNDATVGRYLGRYVSYLHLRTYLPYTNHDLVTVARAERIPAPAYFVVVVVVVVGLDCFVASEVLADLGGGSIFS